MLQGKREVGMALNPISHVQIEAWARLYRVDIGPWEVGVLDKLDEQFRSIDYLKRNPPKATAADAARDAAELKAAKVARAERRAARQKAKEAE